MTYNILDGGENREAQILDVIQNATKLIKIAPTTPIRFPPI